MPVCAKRWAGHPVTSLPSSRIRPDCGWSSPEATRRSVVLPAPFDPSNAYYRCIRDDEIDVSQDELRVIPGGYAPQFQHNACPGPVVASRRWSGLRLTPSRSIASKPRYAARTASEARTSDVDPSKITWPKSRT